jgi:hypothetical protein
VQSNPQRDELEKRLNAKKMDIVASSLLMDVYDRSASQEDLTIFNSALVQWFLYGPNASATSQTKDVECVATSTFANRYEEVVQRIEDSIGRDTRFTPSCPIDSWARGLVMSALADFPILYRAFEEHPDTSVKLFVINHRGHAVETEREFCWHCCASFPEKPFHTAMNKHLRSKLTKNALMTHLHQIGSLPTKERLVRYMPNGHHFAFDGTQLWKHNKLVPAHEEDMLRRELSSLWDISASRYKSMNIVFPVAHHIMNRDGSHSGAAEVD